MKYSRSANLVFFLMILLLQQLAAQEKAATPALFPGDNQFEGWILKDSILVFSGERLYLHVDEAAGLYSEFGYVRSFQADYRDSLANRIQLNVFEMLDADAAWGIFTMNSSGKGQHVEVGNVAILYDYMIHFVKGNYYVRCVTSNNDPAHIDLLMRFATFISSEINTVAKKPALLSAFEFSEMQPQQLKFFKGQLGLNDIFEFGHGSIAGFDQGASSRYEEKMYFVFAYSGERKRREWFASARGKMNMNQRFSDYTAVDEGFTAIDRNGTVFSFTPYKNVILVVRGYSWKEAQAVFSEMKANLDRVLH